MINGAHSIIYSSDPEADRAFLRDVLALPNVDVGGGWLIFGLPPSEVAVHPTDPDSGAAGKHELYFMVEDVEAFQAEMVKRDIVCTPIKDEGWGLITEITLPSGSHLGVYQPKHDRPPPAVPDL